jgi:hypothetical protein
MIELLEYETRELGELKTKVKLSNTWMKAALVIQNSVTT